MLAGLKLFERKKATAKKIQDQQLFFKNPKKLQENKCARVFFRQSCKDIVNFLQETTSVAFNSIYGLVKKSSENVYISLKTESKHQFT